MATLLETYQGKKAVFENALKTSKPAPAYIWEYQELVYRIEVIETLRMFTMSAPIVLEMGQLTTHYQMFNAYIQHLLKERRTGGLNENAKKQRDTAHGSFAAVVDDYRKRFSSFNPSGEADRYRKEISAVICAVIPVWVQYREAQIKIIV
jgi:hypothetical protein